MGKRIKYIVLIFVGYITLCSRSCGPGAPAVSRLSEEMKQKAEIEKIKSEFGSDVLPESYWPAFTAKASQKLSDLEGYLNLYGNKSLQDPFRQQARDMAYSLFLDKSVTLDLPQLSGKRKFQQRSNLEGLFDGIDHSRFDTILFRISDIQSSMSWHPVHDTLYTGKMGCHITITGLHNRDTTLLYNGANDAELWIARMPKQFGQNSDLMVWQVYLGHIGRKP